MLALLGTGTFSSVAAPPNGKLGSIPAGGFKSPEGDPRFSPEQGAKPLNNLVFELLSVTPPGFSQHSFRNPREGWVYVRVPPLKIGSDSVVAARSGPPTVVIDEKQVALKAVGEQLEAMCYLTEGPHTVAMSPTTGKVDRLDVRAIGELVYAAYGSNPHIAETGNYNWDYLRRHCLDNFNSIIGDSTLTPDGKSTQEAELKEWTDEGKRWFTLEPAPDGIRTKTPTKTADEAFEYWTKTPGMSHPLMSGIFGDEFGPGHQKLFPMWNEALRRIHADPKFKNRIFYPYISSLTQPLDEKDSRPNSRTMFRFIQTNKDCDYRTAVEWYQPEGQSRPGRIIAETDDLQAELGPEWERAARTYFEQASPGSSTNRIIVMATLSEPGNETCDLYPKYDFNVWLDCQMQFLATDPAFFGIRGLQGYLSSYCGEEQLRLFAKLLRHYAIEGKTERLLKDPYVLPHLRNPDFENGVEGWTLSPATEASIAPKTATGFGTLQAKYHAPAGVGDAALWTKRNAQKPNLISQQVRNLVPGRLYSLRFITGDYQELLVGNSVRRKHAISIKIDNSEPVVEKCFQAIISNGYFYDFGVFNRNNPYWMNYHQQVFRATAKTAELQLSDWTVQNASKGTEGEELIWNFIQVQPYFE